MGHKVKNVLPKKFQAGFIEKLDKRATVTKELLERYGQLCDDLGGAEGLSYQQRSLAQRALWLEYWVAESERTLCDGGAIDISKHSQAVAMLASVYAKLGLQRVARTRSLSDIIAAGKEKSNP